MNRLARLRLRINLAAAPTDCSAVVVRVPTIPGFVSTLDTGAIDLRVVAADGTVLPHELEGDVVWVRLPSYPMADSFLYLYGGKPGAPDVQDATSVWQAYAAVWHLNGAPHPSKGPPLVGTPELAYTNGLVENGLLIEPSGGQPARYGSSALLSGLTTVSVSAFVERRSSGTTQKVFSIAMPGDTASSRFAMEIGPAGEVRFRVTTNLGQSDVADFGHSLPQNTTQLITVMIDVANALAYLHVDGVSVGFVDLNAITGGTFPVGGAPSTVIGAGPEGALESFEGVIDEVRVRAGDQGSNCTILDQRAQRGELATAGDVEMFAP